MSRPKKTLEDDFQRWLFMRKLRHALSMGLGSAAGVSLFFSLMLMLAAGVSGTAEQKDKFASAGMIQAAIFLFAAPVAILIRPRDCQHDTPSSREPW